MRSAAVAFLLSTFVAALITPLVRRVALRFNLLDRAERSRKIHARPIPRLGGIAIIAGFYAPLVGLARYETSVGQMFYAHLRSAATLMVAGIAIAALGIYDDIRGADAKKKFVVQGLLAIFLWFGGYRIEQMATPFGFSLSLGWAALPFTVIWVVGVINALNLIDGMDGLAGGVALFAIGTTFTIAFLRTDPLMMLFMACLGGGVLGFLFYNFNPASIFMGDTGSMFLGLVLAVSSVQTSQKSSTAVAILVPVIFLGLPIADTLLAMIRRAARGRPLFSADKEHIHHRLLALGLSQRHAVLVLYAACVVLAGAALLLVFANSRQAVLILVLLSVTFVIAVRRLGFLRFEQAGKLTVQRRRNQHLRARVRELGRSLPTVPTMDGIWRAVQSIAGDLGVSAMTLTLKVRDDSTDMSHRFHHGPETPNGLRAAFALGRESAIGGQLELWWEDDRAEIDRDDEIALEVLCDHVANAWEALPRPAPSSSESRLRLLKP